MNDSELTELATEAAGAEINGYRYGENGREPLMIERWRFDALRKAATEALQLASDLLRQHEEGNWIDKDEEYEKTVSLISALASGLKSGTEP